MRLKSTIPIIAIFCSIVGIFILYQSTFALTFFMVTIGGSIGTIAGIRARNKKELELKYFGYVTLVAFLSLVLCLILFAWFGKQGMILIVAINILLLILAIYIIKKNGRIWK